MLVSAARSFALADPRVCNKFFHITYKNSAERKIKNEVKCQIQWCYQLHFISILHNHIHGWQTRKARNHKNPEKTCMSHPHKLKRIPSEIWAAPNKIKKEILRHKKVKTIWKRNKKQMWWRHTYCSGKSINPPLKIKLRTKHSHGSLTNEHPAQSSWYKTILYFLPSGT